MRRIKSWNRFSISMSEKGSVAERHIYVFIWAAEEMYVITEINSTILLCYRAFILSL